MNIHFTRGIGGIMTVVWEGVDTNLNYYEFDRQVSTFSPDGSYFIHTQHISGGGTNDISGGPAYTIAQALGKLSWRSMGGGAPHGWDKASEVNLVLNIGGMARAGSEVFVEAGVGDATEELASQPNSQTLPVTDLTVEGLVENLDATGQAFGKAATGAKVKINLKAAVPYHRFGNTASAPQPVSQTAMPALDNENPNRTKLGVGEKVILHFKPDLTKNAKWETTAGGLLRTNYTSNFFTAPSNANPHVVVQATINGKPVSFPPFNVVAPNGYRAKITGTNHYSPGLIGAGMTNSVHVLPTDVSFYRVTLVELPCSPINISDYFTNMTFNPVQVGQATLTSENSLDDRVVTGPFSPSFPIYPGGFDINVTNYWHIQGSSLSNFFAVIPSMTRLLNSKGDLSKTKYGITITRSTNDMSYSSQ